MDCLNIMQGAGGVWKNIKVDFIGIPGIERKV